MSFVQVDEYAAWKAAKFTPFGDEFPPDTCFRAIEAFKITGKPQFWGLTLSYGDDGCCKWEQNGRCDYWRNTNMVESACYCPFLLSFPWHIQSSRFWNWGKYKNIIFQDAISGHISIQNSMEEEQMELKKGVIIIRIGIVTVSVQCLTLKY